jgi:DNA polymerase I-like protein with 3'-5' exonuclease and polymerase domains
VHASTASVVLHKSIEKITEDERFLGKRTNFAMATGVGPAKLAFMLGVSEEEAREYRDRFFRGYRGLGRYVDRFRNNVPNQLKSPTGRVRHLDMSDPIRARNQALNFIPQEVALTTHLIAANNIERILREKATHSVIVSLIHDSISLDVLKDEEEFVVPAFISALEAPNFHPALRDVIDAGVTFKFELKEGPSFGEQEEYEVG